MHTQVDMYIFIVILISQMLHYAALTLFSGYLFVF